VRHIEVLGLAPRKLLIVLITDSGRVEQRAIDLPEDLDADGIHRLRTGVNEAVVGKSLADAAETLSALPTQADIAESAVLERVSRTLIEQIATNRQDRLVIAGAANLARTEDDFTGSIYPVLEAIEEQVVLLRLFSELEQDSRGVTASIGRENASFGLGETSVVSSNYLTRDGELARIGVLGPTRMDYLNNMAAVRAVARYLSRNLGES
jgi:heat-inducible transcriptional repressor